MQSTIILKVNKNTRGGVDQKSEHELEPVGFLFGAALIQIEKYKEKTGWNNENKFLAVSLGLFKWVLMVDLQVFSVVQY